MFAESSASDLFRKFTGYETNCSTNQMARKPINVNKKKNIVGLKTLLHQSLSEPEFYGDLVYEFKPKKCR